MVAPRTVRRWLWRANAVLAVGAVAALGLVVDGREEPPRFVPVPSAIRAVDPPVGGLSTEQMAGLDAWVATFHGREGPARLPVSPGADGPTRLPLAAFKVTVLIRGEDSPTVVFLRSKDPAHREEYALREGVPCRDAEILAVRLEGDVTVVSVRRGGETWDFPVAWSRTYQGSLIRERTTVERGAGLIGSDLADLGDPGTGPEAKVLPFYGASGNVVGARVTGVRPGSALARMGLRPGDVLCEADGLVVHDIALLRSRLAEGRPPRELTVERSVAESSKRLRLAMP